VLSRMSAFINIGFLLVCCVPFKFELLRTGVSSSTHFSNWAID